MSKLSSSDLESVDIKAYAQNESPAPVSPTSSNGKNGVADKRAGIPKICVVCGDRATGMHFGAMTCEGCKGFFRRSMKKNANFSCAFDKKCGINRVNRKHCQACRLEACLGAGMNSALILSDEQLVEKQKLIKSNKEKNKAKKDHLEQQRLKKLNDIGAQKPQKMTMDDKILIETLLKGHQESYDFGYKEFDTFRGKEQVTSPNKGQSKANTLAWLVASFTKPDQIQAPFSPTASEKNSEKYTSKATGSVSSDTVQPRIPAESEVLDVFSTLHGTAGRSRSRDDDTALPNDSKTDEPEPGAGQQPLITDDDDNPAEPSAADLMCGDDGGTLSYLRGLLRSQGFSLSMMEDQKSKQLLQHFCDIMTWGIKKVIDFCKSIPEFLSLSIVDQIVLLRGGCLEMLVLRSYFAFSSDENKYMSEKFQYQPRDFLQAGASEEFVEKYNSLHMRMRKMQLKVEEICLLLALVLFSPDRPGLEDQDRVEKMQDSVARTLQAYENANRSAAQARTMYSELLLILPILRTINMLFANNIMTLQASSGKDMNPLILEVNSALPEDE